LKKFEISFIKSLEIEWKSGVDLMSSQTQSGEKKQSDIGKENPKRKSCSIIFLSELLLFVLVILVLLILAAKAYDGTCISLELPRQCSVEEYMRQVIALMPFGLFVLGVKYWWIALLLMIATPFLGLKISAMIARKRLP